MRFRKRGFRKYVISKLFWCVTFVERNELLKNEYQANSRVVMQNKFIQDKVMHTDTQKLINQFPCKQKRTISQMLDFKCLGWLSVFPKEDDHFELNLDECRDSLAMRYG